MWCICVIFGVIEKFLVCIICTMDALLVSLLASEPTCAWLPQEKGHEDERGLRANPLYIE